MRRRVNRTARAQIAGPIINAMRPDVRRPRVKYKIGSITRDRLRRRYRTVTKVRQLL
jgi:hypothetical protein